VSSCRCRSGDPPQAVALAAADQVDALGQGVPSPLTADARVRARAEVANSRLAYRLAGGAGCWEREVPVGAGNCDIGLGNLIYTHFLLSYWAVFYCGHWTTGLG
jgi:hypothetical protein